MAGHFDVSMCTTYGSKRFVVRAGRKRKGRGLFRILSITVRPAGTQKILQPWVLRFIVADLYVKTLLAVHRRLDHHPTTRRALRALVNRSIGETRVHAAISKVTRPGDCAWDVGANVGLYTQQFLNGVGPSGHVVAIEPVPENAALLRALGVGSRLTVVEAALADTDGKTPLVVSGVSGETSHIGSDPGEGLMVRVVRGDYLVAEEGIPAPDVLKIDVEGFEGDVLDGLPTALRSIRNVVVEVHFSALSDRGKSQEPLRIIGLLRDAGFTVRWLDMSHLLATRSN
jgi:FkbM family methyltransferase